jgi:hypothetical protein
MGVTSPPEREEQDHAVSAILRAATRNNSANAITGLLLVHPHHFLHALEGPAEALQTTFERIQTDRRHTAVRLIDMARCESRQFGDTTLCSRRVAAPDGTILGDLDPADAADPSALGPDAALQLLMASRAAQARALLAAMA